MKQPLVSVIMPAYNQELYIFEAINSVILQNYQNWELIIVDDGSIDETAKIIKDFNDSRIAYFYQQNKGVSSARNMGLSQMKGDYFCFLDADDRMPIESISDRIYLFLKNKELSFVDGKVRFYSEDFSILNKVYSPRFKGLVESELMKVSDSCFSGISWMIKNEIIDYSFIDGLTHGEDFVFFLSISKAKYYDYINGFVLDVRSRHNSAMSNLNGLEKGYRIIYNEIKKKQELSFYQLLKLKYKLSLIMMKSYLKNGDFKASIFVLFKFFNK